MNELTALDQLGARLDPPAELPPARLRYRVLNQMAQEGAPVRRVRLTGRRLVAAGGLAAVVTAGVLAAQVLQVGDHAPASSASASEILHSAAAQAQRQPSVAVRGDQFVYVESITTSVSVPQGHEPRPGEITSATKQRRIWLSADGSRDGHLLERTTAGTAPALDLVLPGCRDGKSTQTKGGTSVTVPCAPEANYHGDLPTDADRMLAYLYQQGSGTKNPRDQGAFDAAGDLIREAYLSPASLSAVFTALARSPGVTVTGDVTDEAGRSGVAVALTHVQGMRTELVFDRRSGAYLGERSVMVQDDGGLKAGQVINATAVLKVAVVDAVG
jgi:hypothetical protein